MTPEQMKANKIKYLEGKIRAVTDSSLRDYYKKLLEEEHVRISKS